MSIHQNEIGPKELEDRARTGSLIAHQNERAIGKENLYFDGYRYYDIRVPRCTTFAGNGCHDCMYFDRCRNNPEFDPVKIASNIKG